MIRKEDYPSNWREISQNVRDAAAQMCEICGAPNCCAIRRKPKSAEFETVDYVDDGAGNMLDTNDMDWPTLKSHGLTRVVLTVAHLDHNTNNNDRGNLKALCQRCHLMHDKPQRRYGRDYAKNQFKLTLPA
jgi:hypothetical protein